MAPLFQGVHGVMEKYVYQNREDTLVYYPIEVIKQIGKKKMPGYYCVKKSVNN